MAVKNTVTISFKKNDEDMKLKEWIYSHSNYSGFIKDLLRQAMNGSPAAGPAVKEVEQEETELIDLNDF